MIKDTARLVMTLKCNRGCTYCPNGFYKKLMTKLENFDDLDKYNNICITGGEPLLDCSTLLALLDDLRLLRGNFKIYLYASDYDPVTVSLPGVMQRINGLTWTLHENTSFDDMQKFNHVQALLSSANDNRLVLHTKAMLQWAPRINYLKWNRVTVLQMTEHTCSLPPNEDLLIMPEACK
jgi:organic radical activating enzyme